ncbi:MAG: trehalose-6-phosphate synthase [Candidatus Paceibacterota bacterium]|jgi:trehalose 6-phosphate synthase
MRYIFAIIGSVVVTVAVVSFFLNLKQVNEERATLTINLEQRASLLADSLKESVEPSYVNSGEATLQTSLQKIVNKFANRERLAGIALYDNKGTLLATSSGLPKTIIENTKSISDAMDSNTPKSDFFDADGESRYVFVDPLHNDEGSILGALMIVQNAGYINTTIGEIWRGNLIRLIVQIIIFSITIFIILRFFVFRQVVRLVDSIKKIRMGGKNEIFKDTAKYSFFKPLAKEITHMTNSLLQARSSASEEARMRLEKLDTPWTAERLKEFVKAYLKDQKVFLVFKGEPYTHKKGKDGIYYFSQAGGVLTALEPLMEACGGMWIAHGSGDADKETVDENDTIKVPPDNPKYTLKRVWLTDKEEQGYNKSYSAEGLYPLCLNTHTRPIFKEEDWIEYKKVNGKFAKILLSEIKNVQRPIIIVNEYHFTLLPQMIKKSRPDARIGIFWHTPWPSAEAFSICPQRKEILTGMLGADVIGFHTQQFGNNFIDTVGKNVESLIDFDKFAITQDEHTSYIRSFPTGVDFTKEQDSENATLPGKKILSNLKIKTKFIGLGVDRLDYAKGIPERFKGIEYFLENHPEYREHFTFLQIASPCRSEIEKYLEYKELVSREAERINKKFGTKEWQPIVLEMIQYSHPDINSLYKLANVCVVTSLHDGMNLVSKEYVAERNDELGVLILSQFTGASYDLKGALIINPYSTKEIGDAIYKGIIMAPVEQTRRMKTMRSSVKNYNIYRWAAELLKAIVEL